MDKTNQQNEERHQQKVGQHQQHYQQQHQHHHHQQLQSQQQQRQPLGSSSSSSCSSSCGSKNPLISSNPAFKYFQDQLSKGGSDNQSLTQAEVVKKSDAVKKEDTDNSTTVKLFSTMPKKSSQPTAICDDLLRADNKTSNKIHIISKSSNNRASNNDLNNNNKSNSNDANNDKAKVNVAKLIKQHHDEIQSNSHFKRNSGSDRYKWFFRSLRGERAHKSADEDSSVREVECSRCRLASLTASQMEENIEKLQTSLAETTAQLESLSRSLADKDDKLKEMESKFSRLTAENGELKASIHRLISEQIFGRRVLMNSDPHQNSSTEGHKFNSSQLHHTLALGVRGKPSCLSQPSLTLMADLHRETDPRNGNSRSAKNINGFVNNNHHHNQLFSPIRSACDDEDYDDDPCYYDDDNNADDDASIFVPLGKNRTLYPAIKPKPSINLSTHPSPPTSVHHPKNKRLRELSLSDREWHSSEGFNNFPPLVAMVTGVMATGSGGGRSAKSSFELDDSLCVEYPNRTFRQQMECLKGVTKSVESLKSEPSGQKFKARRRRGTVANPEGGVDYTMYPLNTPSNNKTFIFSRTRKLSSYTTQQQQYDRSNNLDRDCLSEVTPTRKKSEQFSSDHLTHPSSPRSQTTTTTATILEQHKQLPELDPRNYYLNRPNNEGCNHGNKSTRNNSAHNHAHHNNSTHPTNHSPDKQTTHLMGTVERLEKQMLKDQRAWLEEKMRVIEYQKKLQDAYLQVSGQCKRMESELRLLRSST